MGNLIYKCFKILTVYYDSLCWFGTQPLTWRFPTHSLHYPLSLQSHDVLWRSEIWKENSVCSDGGRSPQPAQVHGECNTQLKQDSTLFFRLVSYFIFKVQLIVSRLAPGQTRLPL